MVILIGKTFMPIYFRIGKKCEDMNFLHSIYIFCLTYFEVLFASNLINFHLTGIRIHAHRLFVCEY
jgi:hypothetical protein